MANLLNSNLNCQNLKSSSSIKDADEIRTKHREKAMLVFAFQLLIDRGYLETATCLSKESLVNLEDFIICDNIDLRSIFIEFESFYHLKYQRFPQYFKKGGPLTATEAMLNKMKANPYLFKNSRKTQSAACKKVNGSSQNSPGIKLAEREGSLSVIGSNQKLSEIKNAFELGMGDWHAQNNLNHDKTEGLDDDFKLMKPISSLDLPNEEIRSLAETIQKDVIMKNLNVKWEDVIGLQNAKSVLKETLQYTKDFLEFFGTGLSPWRGLLLYGPPGVGKTLLAKAVASECGTTFFNISSASIVSKWRGDSEKSVKALFQLARYHAPSTIFFDEFDALGSSRDSAGESDASRRLKSEILQHMDGILSSSQNESSQVFILAATNLPWELDAAILRRLEKRVYVPLPNIDERLEIFKLHFNKTAHSVYITSQGKNTLRLAIEYEYLSQFTDGFSGSDIQQVVKETIIRKFRNCHAGEEKKIRSLKIKTEDALDVVRSFQPTVFKELIEKFNEWTRG